MYAEWAGGKRLGIIDEALAFGRATGTIPAAAPDVISQGNDKRFRSQLAVGASYTTENKITFNLEYHYNEAGILARGLGPLVRDRRGTPGRFTRSRASSGTSAATRPIARSRCSAIPSSCARTGSTSSCPSSSSPASSSPTRMDGSTLMQLEASYARTDLWSFGVLAGGTAGGRRSNFGSLPRAASILFKATRYF